MSKGRILVAFSCIFVYLIDTSFIPRALAAENNYGSAAEMDWQSAADMHPDDRASLSNFCAGRYVVPQKQLIVAPGLLGATADEVKYLDGQSITLTGNVVLNQDDLEVHAPKIVQDEETQIAEIDGPLQLRKSNQLITGEHATVNIADGSGVIDKGTFLLHQSSYRGNSATIHLVENGNILMDDATLTRCEPGSSAWAINADEMELIPSEGVGIARNMTIRVKDVPVIYFPYLRFPINDDRQSGFLLPNIGYDSDGGTDINIPYYFNLAPAMDATYELRSLWQRGLVHDGQFRFMTRRSLNEINAAYLHEDDIYDERIRSGGLGDFEKVDRWLLYARHDGGLGSRWKTSINYSTVSDIDYLHDIGGDVGSSAIEQFINPVNTSLTNRRTAALDRVGTVEYRGNGWDSKLALQGFQSLDPIPQAQYEKLPSLTTNWFRQIGPINATLKLEYTFFDKNNSGLSGSRAIIGERAVADFNLNWPLRKLWGYIQPGIGLIHRKYNLDDTPSASRANPEITIPRFIIDSGLYFDRFFKWGDTDIQQTLEPKLYFLYVDYANQSDLPEFDSALSTLSYSGIFRPNRFIGYDRIGDARQVSLGITTRLLSEKNGAEFFSASVGQIYYFKDRQVIYRAVPVDNPEARESPLFTQARLSLANGLSVSHTLEWEPDVSRTNRATFGIKYRADERKIFNLGYIYTNPDVQAPSLIQKAEESDLSFIWPLAKRWSAIGRWNFGWDDHRTIESFVGLEYNDCCWKSRLVVRRFLKEPRTTFELIDDPDSPGDMIRVADISTPADVGIFFEFQLKGLATVGKRLDSLLEDGIPGYRKREDLIGL